jgi:hypothetical protein
MNKFSTDDFEIEFDLNYDKNEMNETQIPINEPISEPNNQLKFFTNSDVLTNFIYILKTNCTFKIDNITKKYPEQIAKKNPFLNCVTILISNDITIRIFKNGTLLILFLKKEITDDVCDFFVKSVNALLNELFNNTEYVVNPVKSIIVQARQFDYVTKSMNMQLIIEY